MDGAGDPRPSKRARAAASGDGAAEEQAGGEGSPPQQAQPGRQQVQHPPLRILRIEEPPGCSVRVYIQSSTAASTQAQLDRLVTLRRLPPLVAATAAVGARWLAVAAPGACPHGMEMWLDGASASAGSEEGEGIAASVGRRLQTGFIHSARPTERYKQTSQMAGGRFNSDMLGGEFWTGLLAGTGASVCSVERWAARQTPDAPPSAEELAHSRSELRTEGYCHLPGASRPEEATALAAAVSTLVLHGWHPLWCVVCDEAWLWIARQRERLLAVASPDGEPAVQLNYDFMAWYIDPVATQSGWAPHRDRHSAGLAAGGGTEYATVWLALTEATPSNGCMYALPASFDPFYHTAEGEAAAPEGGSAAEMQAFDSERREWVSCHDIAGIWVAFSPSGLHSSQDGSDIVVDRTPRMALALSLSTRDRHADLGNHLN